jgi:hypothetical protein
MEAKLARSTHWNWGICDGIQIEWVRNMGLMLVAGMLDFGIN